jgi:hypothetical protein
MEGIDLIFYNYFDDILYKLFVYSILHILFNNYEFN